MARMSGRRTVGGGIAVLVTAALGATAVGGVSSSRPAVAPDTVRVEAAANVAAVPVQKAAGIPGLATALDAVLTDARLSGATSRVVVRDATTGEMLYNRNGWLRGTPASNEKLLTSAAAMDLLGPGFRFTTAVRRTGTVAGGRLTGNIYLRGSGDPTTLAADYDRLAVAVADTGITSVSGRLVVDDTAFDAVRLGPSWSWDNEPYAYSAQVSALTVAPDTDYDAGAVAVSLQPGRLGGRPTVTFAPSSSRFSVDNRATTGAAGTADTLAVTRVHGANRFLVTGSVPLGARSQRVLLSVWDPSFVAADVFRAALARRGVTFDGAPVLQRGATPAGAPVIAVHRSAPLSSILVPFLKLSNNNHAEVIVKAIGRKQSGAGTWPAGLAAIRTWLAANGVAVSAIRMSDGSGLSRTDLLTGTQVTNLLISVRDKPWFSTWYGALPVAGQPARLVGGTLRLRMRGTAAAGNVRAKTGSLTSVSALSGYVTNAAGRRLVFSVMFDDLVAGSVKDLEDRVAVALARSGAPAAAANGLGGTPDAAVTPAPVVKDDPRTDVDESQLECSWVGAC